MEKEFLLDKNTTLFKKDRQDRALYFLNDAKELISSWKKNPESNLEGDEFRKLSKINPTEAQRKKENKFRKNYFNNVISDLAAAKIDFQDKNLDLLWKELELLSLEISNSPKVDESQIDSFDDLALKIIKIMESLKN